MPLKVMSVHETFCYLKNLCQSEETSEGPGSNIFSASVLMYTTSGRRSKRKIPVMTKYKLISCLPDLDDSWHHIVTENVLTSVKLLKYLKEKKCIGDRRN